MSFVVVFSALSLRSEGDNIVKFTELECLERARHRRRTIALSRTLTMTRGPFFEPETSTAVETPATTNMRRRTFSRECSPRKTFFPRRTVSPQRNYITVVRRMAGNRSSARTKTIEFKFEGNSISPAPYYVYRPLLLLLAVAVCVF